MIRPSARRSPISRPRSAGLRRAGRERVAVRRLRSLRRADPSPRAPDATVARGAASQGPDRVDRERGAKAGSGTEAPAPDSRLRARIVPVRRGPGRAEDRRTDRDEPSAGAGALVANRRARRLERVFGIDIAPCPACSGQLRLLACIEDRRTVDAILTHLARNSACTRVARRVPPSAARARSATVNIATALRLRFQALFLFPPCDAPDTASASLVHLCAASVTEHARLEPIGRLAPTPPSPSSPSIG